MVPGAKPPKRWIDSSFDTVVGQLQSRELCPGRPQAEPGSTIRLGRVLAHKSGGKFAVGQPYLSDVTVEAQVLDELKGPKIIVSPLLVPPVGRGAPCSMQFEFLRAEGAPHISYAPEDGGELVHSSTAGWRPSVHEPRCSLVVPLLRWPALECRSSVFDVHALQIFKHNPKKHYQRKTGHRQPLSKFLVTKIGAGSA